MLIQFNHVSRVLVQKMNCTVMIPEEISLLQDKSQVKTLYLLHGMFGDNVSWLNSSRIYDYAHKYNICVVAPSADNSFYCNNVSGYLNYYDYITEELPELIQNTFGLLNTRENSFIAGLSMGGYGALKIGSLTNNFISTASFSGALFKLEELIYANEAQTQMLQSVFTAKATQDYTNSDIYEIIKSHKPDNLFISCGLNDDIPHLHEVNLRFLETLKELNIPYEYYTDEHKHDYSHWDNAIVKYLDYLQAQGLL